MTDPMTAPYWSSPDGNLTLYHGDFRDVLPALGLQPDLLVVDPPYASTSLAWDRWPDGWPGFLAEHTTTDAMWCFGSMRMFLDHISEFSDWTLSQDIVWEKHNGSTFHADRFRRVHEHALHWYRGQWRDVHHEPPTTDDATARTVRRKKRPAHTGHIGAAAYVSEDGGPRLMRSVLQARSAHGRAIHPTEKPTPILRPLIEYACRPGGLVLDPMAGSGSTLDAARQTGRRCVGIERHEPYAEAAAIRLSSQLALEFS
jgi:site-specific DNA-methyltransferase (adenine-specific)